ncbi:MAG: hypothetical protein ACYTXC_02000 [Nostoc sp.]
MSLQRLNVRAKSSDFRVQRLNVRAKSSDFRVQRLNLRVKSSDFRVQRLNLRVKSSDFRVQRLNFGVLITKISERARILAVVGLHVNTFKPHTGTKTSVLFLQKWNDDPNSKHYCPRLKDYPIFFATSENSGKDNSGEYVYKLGVDGKPMIDDHRHMIIDHDLDEIASAFVDFAKKQKFSFWRDG